MTDLRLIALACIVALGVGLFFGLEWDYKLKQMRWWQ